VLSFSVGLHSCNINRAPASVPRAAGVRGQARFPDGERVVKMLVFW
jgi:hypothetical protein